MRNKPTTLELALALELTTHQISILLDRGEIKRTTSRKTINAIKRVQLTLIEASEIWGFSSSSRQLGKHADNGTLELANPDEVHSRWNPRLVTVAAMLELMDLIDRPARGLTR
jgi:hypothetical protein